MNDKLCLQELKINEGTSKQVKSFDFPTGGIQNINLEGNPKKRTSVDKLNYAREVLVLEHFNFKGESTCDSFS